MVKEKLLAKRRKIGYINETNKIKGFMNKDRNILSKNMILFAIACSIFVSMSNIGYTREPIIQKVHNGTIIGNITDPGCIDCHIGDSASEGIGNISKITRSGTIRNKENRDIRKEDTTNRSFIISGINNYTAIIEVGQTPYQLGPFFREGYNGWSWWDNDEFGTDKQKNLILLSIFDNTTGTIKPIQGLTSWPTWPKATYRKYGGTYSYKADSDPSPIAAQNNYPDNTEILMIKEVDLSGLSGATLNFWTWYSMELDWDYGYVAVSTDNGDSWINLPGTLTTNTNPNGNNLGNGITGNSGGIWKEETMDLTPYVGSIGSKILLGFKFKSDAEVNEEGWYVDYITVTGGFSDDVESSVEIKTLSVNVTYPRLIISGATDPLTSGSILQYTDYIQKVELYEVINHPGTYMGYFKYDPFASQYSGIYTVDLNAAINGEQVTGSTTFDTTIFGCQSCHNKKLNDIETSFAHGDGGGMQSCMYICHSGSRGLYGDAFMGPPVDANPIHVHEMKYGHQGGFLDGAYYPQPPYNVPSHVTQVGCEDCHTSFIHDNAGSDTAKIGNYTLYGKNITFSSGTHEGLTCEQCHGDLSYPIIPTDQFSITDNLGDNNISFTSSISFTDTYAINVNRNNNLDINIHANDGTTKSISVYVIGPVDNTTKALQGPCYGNPCYKTQSLSSDINMNIANPYIGTWLVKLYMLQGGTIDYTITSNYPIERKPIIKIPECKECHNSNAQGNAYTTYDIPNWNPGYAHADTNDDGNLDIQCRMCHNPMHNITVKTCRDCHSIAPTNHVIKEPLFSQYTTSQCIQCHEDPHRVTIGGGSCIDCHQNDVNISKFARHANLNTSDGQDVVSDYDCWTCHRNKDMNKNNVYLCESCHINNSGVVPVTDPVLIIPDFSHGPQQCKNCHAPVKYHMEGRVGPKGLMDFFDLN